MQNVLFFQVFLVGKLDPYNGLKVNKTEVYISKEKKIHPVLPGQSILIVKMLYPSHIIMSCLSVVFFYSENCHPLYELHFQIDNLNLRIVGKQK